MQISASTYVRQRSVTKLPIVLCGFPLSKSYKLSNNGKMTTHLVKGSQHHVRAGDSFRKGYMNLSKTSELIDDLEKLTDTEDLQKSLK